MPLSRGQSNSAHAPKGGGVKIVPFYIEKRVLDGGVGITPRAHFMYGPILSIAIPRVYLRSYKTQLAHSWDLKWNCGEGGPCSSFGHVTTSIFLKFQMGSFKKLQKSFKIFQFKISEKGGICGVLKFKGTKLLSTRIISRIEEKP